MEKLSLIEGPLPSTVRRDFQSVYSETAVLLRTDVACRRQFKYLLKQLYSSVASHCKRIDTQDSSELKRHFKGQLLEITRERDYYRELHTMGRGTVNGLAQKLLKLNLKLRKFTEKHIGSPEMQEFCTELDISESPALLSSSVEPLEEYHKKVLSLEGELSELKGQNSSLQSENRALFEVQYHNSEKIMREYRDLLMENSEITLNNERLREECEELRRDNSREILIQQNRSYQVAIARLKGELECRGNRLGELTENYSKTVNTLHHNIGVIENLKRELQVKTEKLNEK